MGRRIGIDANILLRTNVRNVVSAALESLGHTLLIPETAVETGAPKYARASRGTVNRMLNRRRAGGGKGRMEKEALDRMIEEKQEAMGECLRRWVRTSTSGNSTEWEWCPSTEETRKLARRMYLRGLCWDPNDDRFGTGEDMQVVAETLLAGGQWIAAHNLKATDANKLNVWIEEEQREGRLSAAQTPFVIDVDTATNELVAEAIPNTMGEKDALGWQTAGLVAAIHDITGSAKEQVDTLSAIATYLKRGGAETAGDALDGVLEEARDSERHGVELCEQVMATVARWRRGLGRDPALTRMREERRRSMERMVVLGVPPAPKRSAPRQGSGMDTGREEAP